MITNAKDVDNGQEEGTAKKKAQKSHRPRKRPENHTYLTFLLLLKNKKPKPRRRQPSHRPRIRLEKPSPTIKRHGSHSMRRWDGHTKMFIGAEGSRRRTQVTHWWLYVYLGGEREMWREREKLGHINGESDVMNLFPESTTAKDGDRFLAGLTGNI